MDIKKKAKKRNWDIFFCCLFFISFFYELPLWQFSFDRINPRLFDIVFIFGIIKYWKYIFDKEKESSILKVWRYLLITFSICSIYWTLFVPFNISLFSLLAICRYWQSYILIKIVVKINPDLDIVCKVSFLGLLFVSIWCFFEYQNPVTKDGLYEVTPGQFVAVPKNAIFGPLSPNYFHIGQLVPLASILSLAYALKKQNIYLIIGALVLSWPVLFVGSRTSLGLSLLSILFFCWFNKKKLRVMALVFFAFLMIVFSGNYIYDSLLNNSLTFQRTVELEKGDRNTIEGRMEISEHFLGMNYDATFSEKILLGTGFNISPVNRGHYRIGYGIHSLYLYPLEQGGILAFIIFIIFIIKIFKSLRPKDIYSSAVFSYFIAMLIVGVGAHNFWREFGSGNINTYILVCFILFSLNKNINLKKMRYENIIDK